MKRYILALILFGSMTVLGSQNFPQDHEEAAAQQPPVYDQQTLQDLQEDLEELEGLIINEEDDEGEMEKLNQ